MGTLVKRMDRALYADSSNNWDDEILRQRILARIRPHFVILDVGAGAGILPQMNFRGLVTRVCGIDLDPRVVENPMLDEAKVANAGAIPYADDSFDIVLADNVLEHIEEPPKFFSEIARVLKPGGLLLFKTPNKWHYVPTISRLTPHWFHQSYNQLRGRSPEDTFPTCYSANSRSDVSRLAAHAGLQVERLDCIEGRPQYLRITAATYVVGAVYERVVNSSRLLEGLRVVLICELRKPMAGERAAG